MTSQHMRRLLRVQLLGARLGLFPYYFDYRPYSELVAVDQVSGAWSAPKSPLSVWGNKRQRVKYWIVNGAVFFVGSTFIFVGSWYDHTRRLRLSIRLPFYFFSVGVAMFMGLQLVVAVFAKKIFALCDTFTLFDMKIHEVLKLNPWEKDGSEVYFKAIILGGAGLLVTYPIGVIAMRANNLGVFLDSGMLNHVVAVFCEGENATSTDFGNYGAKWTEVCRSFEPSTREALKGVDAALRVIGLYTTPLTSPFFLLAGLMYTFHFTSMAMVYCNAIYRCLKLSAFTCRGGQEAAPAREFKYQLYVLYKALEVLHDFMMQQSNQVILASIGLAAGLLISSLVTLISFSDDVPPIIVAVAAGAAVMTLLITKLLFRLASVITNLSREFRDSYLRNDRALRPVERLRLRSCRTLRISAGGLFIVAKHTYITFVADVVLDNVINLVIDFRMQS